MKKSNLKAEKQHDITNLAFGTDLQHLHERYKAGGETRKGKMGCVPLKIIAAHPCVEAFAIKYNMQAEYTAGLIIQLWKGEA